MILREPKSYLAASSTTRRAVCNGAGPRRFGWLVPDTVYGLRITEAADIHDWMYNEGVTHEDKYDADLTFLRNMVAIIMIASGPGLRNKVLTRLRIMRAVKYFLAVWWGGNKAFQSGKDVV